MHRWLKQYVFKQTRTRLGPGPAVVMTYVASTLLHGLSGQLAAVLLSLGFYTWVEHSLREKLSNIMDASIGARREAECRRKVGSFIVTKSGWSGTNQTIFLATTSSSRSDNVTLSACLSACLSPYFS